MLLEAIDSSRSQICRPHILLEKKRLPRKIELHWVVMYTTTDCFFTVGFLHNVKCVFKKFTKNNYIENAKILKKKRVFMGKKLAFKVQILWGRPQNLENFSQSNLTSRKSWEFYSKLCAISHLRTPLSWIDIFDEKSKLQIIGENGLWRNSST